ncbi:hypothetical protein AVEN_273852-1, partial [Araneus ventricosus]
MGRVCRNYGFPTRLNIRPFHLDCQDINSKMRARQRRGGGSLPSDETGADR